MFNYIMEPSVKDETDERAERVQKRAFGPKEEILQYLLTHNYSNAISDHNKYVEDMIENPVKIYMLFKERLENNGCEASFPEFEGVVGFLIKGLFQNTVIYSWFNKDNKHILIDQLINKIVGLTIEDRFHYPYSSTIYVIENLLELLDYYYRSTVTNPTNPHVNETIGPYYHIFRYRSYITTFLCSKYGIPNNIMFPTHFNISATSLIKIRCVPILVMGVVDKPIYVDQYLNSPLDFWAHDIQHSKRQIQETLRYYDVFVKHNNYYKTRTLYDIKTPIQFYQYMHDFTVTKILPMIVIDKETDSDEIKAFKSIKRLIIFEVVHEKAWPITQPSLCRNISLRYDEFPVENINIKDGKIGTYHYLFSDPTTIGNVIAKLRHGFYDKSTDPKKFIVAKEYRTSENVAKCAREIMTALECSKNPSSEYFLSLATDKHALQEFQDLPPIDIPDNPVISVPYPTKNTDNIYNDADLMTKFIPEASPDDDALQGTLHKKTGAEPSEPISFENKLGGKNTRKIKSRKHYIYITKKTKTANKKRKQKTKKNPTRIISKNLGLIKM